MDKQYVVDRVSVIIPIYNCEKYIGETLESIFEQTYSEIEIVLVDDCSTDHSGNIIAEYKKKHPEIVYFLQEKNMGAGAARNKALELATGQYAAFLDSDDIWLPNKLERQIEMMKQKKSPFSYTAIAMIDDDNTVIKTKRKVKESCEYDYLLHNTMIATSSVVIDREVFGDFRMSLRRGGQDYATWLMLLRDRKNTACGINEVLVYYRVRSNSLSSNKWKSVKQVWEIQRQEEKIGPVQAVFHVMCFLVHALKKYLF